MKRNRTYAAAMVMVWSLVSIGSASDTVSVLSVNVRNSLADDKENAWLKRRDFLADVVRAVPYDFIGMQEVIVDSPEEVNQLGFLAQKLPEYAFLSRGRGENPDQGEAVPIFYRKDRWEIDPEEQGFFWLSDTPDVPGSNTWKDQSGHARSVTWALFYERNEKSGKRTGKSLYVFNTHYDHKGETARIKASVLLMRKIAERKSKAIPTVLTGDFNADEGSKPIRCLLGNTVEIDGKFIKPPLALRDSYRLVHPHETDVFTTHGFREPKPVGMKIDHVFVTPELEAISAEVVKTRNRQGRFPTDHFPINAVLRFPEPARTIPAN
ncbi:MAG TPA: hypothetical protein DEB39_07520 [Planctomycetaceae bacterium]|nr:hypothetical protein [Planctomycetaceae bacterium]